jgi:death-on-curing protein
VIRYLTLAEVLELHRLVVGQTGGAAGLRDLGALEAAVAQPRQSFGGQDLYPSLAAKVAALGFGLIANHAFVDGNKRVGHAAMDTMLLLNGAELRATIDDAEGMIVRVAAGQASREELLAWVEAHVVSVSS